MLSPDPNVPCTNTNGRFVVSQSASATTTGQSSRGANEVLAASGDGHRVRGEASLGSEDTAGSPLACEAVTHGNPGGVRCDDGPELAATARTGSSGHEVTDRRGSTRTSNRRSRSR